MNFTLLSAHVGKDPEVRHLESGKVVANFSLATNDGAEKTNWHNIVVWNKSAEVAEKYVKKGSKIAVQGQTEYRSYQDKEGNNRWITEIVCFRIELLDKKPDSSQTTSTGSTNTEPEWTKEPDWLQQG